MNLSRQWLFHIHVRKLLTQSGTLPPAHRYHSDRKTFNLDLSYPCRVPEKFFIRDPWERWPALYGSWRSYKRNSNHRRRFGGTLWAHRNLVITDDTKPCRPEQWFIMLTGWLVLGTISARQVRTVFQRVYFYASRILLDVRLPPILRHCYQAQHPFPE